MGVNYNPSVVKDGLFLYLDAANKKSYSGTGTTWTDLTANGYIGTLFNGTAYSNGSLVFDGSDDYVDLGTSYLIATGLPFTVNLFLKINIKPLTGTQSDFHRILTLRALGTSTLGIAFVNQLNSGYSGLYITNNNGWPRAFTSYYPGDNQWFNLVVTYNGSGSTDINNFKMFVNCNSLTFNTSGVATPPVTTDNNYLGCRQLSDVQAFRGNIANIQLYNRVLTTAEIQQNYVAMRGRFGL